MGTFDELLAKAKELAKAAGNKTEEVVGLTKLRMQAAQLRSEIDSNYMKLGEIIYELSKAGTENQELVNMCIAELEVQQEELAKLNEKINEMKNVIQCPDCGASNPNGSLFCARCGASLKAVQKPEDEQPQEEDTVQPALSQDQSEKQSD